MEILKVLVYGMSVGTSPFLPPPGSKMGKT